MRKEISLSSFNAGCTSVPDLITWHKWLPNWSSFKLARDTGRVKQRSLFLQGSELCTTIPAASARGSSARRSHSIPAVSAVTSQQGAAATVDETAMQPKHLVVFVHGLWGTRNDWRNIYRHFSSILPKSIYMLHVSTANEWLNTYSGVDVCGQRLADEMKGIVEKHPSLTHISIVGHSLGGLISRYAIGCSFDPESKRVLGLEPCHFITLATPHMGATWTGAAQVPLIQTFTSAPLVGSLVQTLQSKLETVTGFWLGRTGEMLFHLDGAPAQNGEPERRPLLETMCWDQPEKKLYCYSALSSFKTRTCYANAVGDHMVGWANASVRRLDQLPKFTEAHLKGACGVVAEDCLAAATTLPASLYYLQEGGNSFNERRQSALQKADLGRGATFNASPIKWRPRAGSPWKSKSMPVGSHEDYKDSSPRWLSRSAGGSKVSRTLTTLAAKLGIDAVGNNGDGGIGKNASDSITSKGVSDGITSKDDSCGIISNTGSASGRQPAVLEEGEENLVTSVTSVGVQGLVASTSDSLSPSDTGPATATSTASLPTEVGPAGWLAAAPAVNAASSSSPALSPSSSSLPAEASSSSAQATIASAPIVSTPAVNVMSSSSPPSLSPTSSARPPQDLSSVHAAAASAAAAVEAATTAVDASSSSNMNTSTVSGNGSGPSWTNPSTAQLAQDPVAMDLGQTGMSPGVQDGAAVQDDVALRIVGRLQTLPWRRIDVSFKGAMLGFAHNNIQYNRPINFAGKSVINHLAHILVEMEADMNLDYGAVDARVPGEARTSEDSIPAHAGGHFGESVLTPQEDDQISVGLFEEQDP